MNDPIFTIQADQSTDQLSLLLALIIAGGALLATVVLLRRKTTRDNRTRTLLLAMLFFFAFLIASSTAFFSWLSARRTGPVMIYAEAIETPYGRVSFDNIRNASIEEEKERSLINQNIIKKTTRLLVIEEKNGKAHVLSEQNYPIQQILGELKAAVKKWEEKSGD